MVIILLPFQNVIKQRVESLPLRQRKISRQSALSSRYLSMVSLWRSKLVRLFCVLVKLPVFKFPASATTSVSQLLETVECVSSKSRRCQKLSRHVPSLLWRVCLSWQTARNHVAHEKLWWSFCWQITHWIVRFVIKVVSAIFKIKRWPTEAIDLASGKANEQLKTRFISLFGRSLRFN